LLNSVESALRRRKCTRIGLVFSEQCNFTKRMVFAVQARSDFFGMNLFEYVKVLKVEDPPDRAGRNGIAGGALKGTDG